MASGFDDAKKAEQVILERDFRIALKALLDGRPLDFDEVHKNLRAIAETQGQSKKGAQAWASLKLLDVKKALDAKAAGDPRVQEFIASLSSPEPDSH